MYMVLRIDDDKRRFALSKEDLLRMPYVDDFAVNPYFKRSKRPLVQRGFYTYQFHSPIE
jgi:hypothetical protein